MMETLVALQLQLLSQRIYPDAAEFYAALQFTLLAASSGLKKRDLALS